MKDYWNHFFFLIIILKEQFFQIFVECFTYTMYPIYLKQLKHFKKYKEYEKMLLKTKVVKKIYYNINSFFL